MAQRSPASALGYTGPDRPHARAGSENAGRLLLVALGFPPRVWVGVESQVESGSFPPKLLKAVTVAHLRNEDVQNAVEIVHENPACLTCPFNSGGQHSIALLQRFVDGVVDGLGLALIVQGSLASLCTGSSSS